MSQTDSLIAIKSKEVDQTEKLNNEIAARKKEVLENIDSYITLQVEEKHNSTFGDELYGVVISIENKSDYLINDAIILVHVINYRDQETDKFNSYSKAILPHSKNRIEIGDLKKASKITLELAAITSKALGINETTEIKRK